MSTSETLRKNLADQLDQVAKIAQGLRNPSVKDQPHIRNLQSDIVVEQCADARPDLVGCNNAELMEASAGTLSCPPLSKATDPLIVDEAGRICYARKDLLEAWKEADVDKDGKVQYVTKEVNGKKVRVPKMVDKTLNIDDLTNKYANQLIGWLSKNDKLQIALASSLDSSGTLPPIILNYYRNNPYIIGFCENKSKRETRYTALNSDMKIPLQTSKRFRGLLKYSNDNSAPAYRTRNEFATLVTSFTSSLETDSGAKFMSVFINPLNPGDQIRGMFDIHTPTPEYPMDFLGIGPHARHDTNDGQVYHSVHGNVTELIFTAISALYRDSVRYPKLKKFVNSMGDLLQFGEFASEIESPENKCRQAGVAAANAVAFLPQALKKWLANLPSTWRKAGPEADPDDAMQQRIAGTPPIVDRFKIQYRAIVNARKSLSGENGLYQTEPLSEGTLASPAAFSANAGTLFSRGVGAASFASASSASAASASAASRGGGASIPQQLSELLSKASAPPAVSGVTGLGGGQSLEGGASFRPNQYLPLSGTVILANNEILQRANPVTVTNGEETVEDPRLVMQNFISLCFYLNWVEMYGHSSSDDSVLGLFKSLRASYENMIKARMSLEELLKIKATEKITTVVSAVSEKMVDDAINNKKGADASYLGVNVRIAKKMAKLLDIGWENCESITKLTSASQDPANNGWADKMLPHQKLFKSNPDDPWPRWTVNQLPGVADNRINAAYGAGGINNPGFALDGSVGYPDLAAGNDAETTGSFQIRDYDFVATTKPVRNWINRQVAGAGGAPQPYANVAIGDPVKYTYQYDESRSALDGFGINTVEFRKAWKNSYTTYEGIKHRVNYMNKVGYEQLQSRIFDFHLTFAQSCAAARDYFVKMFKYSKTTNFRKDGGIPEDPRSITKDMFDDDNGAIVQDYKNAVAKTNELLKPLSGMDICKVVLGDSQYYIYKNNAAKPTAVQAYEAGALAAEINKKVNLGGTGDNVVGSWWQFLVSMGQTDGVPFTDGGLRNNNPVQKALIIIESDISYTVDSVRGVTSKTPKFFGSCEPMDQGDYNMYNRRKKMLDFEHPEDELFFKGVEAWARLYSRTRYGKEANGRARPEYSNTTLRGETVQGIRSVATDGAVSEIVPFTYSKEDSKRREGEGGNQSLNALERDAYARFIILLYKISAGNPAKIANKVLNMVGNDELVAPNGALIAPYNGLRDTPVNIAWELLVPDAVPAAGALPAIDVSESKRNLTRAEYIAMNLVGLSLIPAPLFATMGNLAGGVLQGGETQTQEMQTEMQIQELPAPEPESLDMDMDNLMNDLLTGGRDDVYGSSIKKPPVKQSPRPSKAADDRTADEVELDIELERIGYPPVNRIKVGPNGPKILNKFGTNSTGVFVESDDPWLQCQKTLGVQYYSKVGNRIRYWYNDKEKCYRPADASSQARSTYEKLESFQNLARLINNATQSDRLQELDKARKIILADPANDRMSHDDVEALAHSMIPGNLQALPTYSALKTASWVSEDVVSQINEITDSSMAEERSRLMKLIRDNSLMSEEWKDEDALVELEHLKALVEDMVKQANQCTVVSESIKDNSTVTELRKNMHLAVNVGGTLDPEFKEGLSPKAKLYLNDANFASKCDVQNLGVNKAVLIPAQIKNRIDEEALTRGEEKALNPVVQWWRQAYNRTAMEERKQAEKLERLIDPHNQSNSESLTDIGLRKATMEDKILSAVDRNAAALLPKFKVRE